MPFYQNTKFCTPISEICLSIVYKNHYLFDSWWKPAVICQKNSFLNQSNETNPFYLMTEIFAHHIKKLFTN